MTPLILDYGLALTHMSQSAFEANTDHYLRNWRALMGGSGLPWMPATDNLVEYGTRVKQPNGHIKYLGSIIVSPWTLVLKTIMCQYLETTIFQGNPSVNVTFQTYDQHNDEWLILQGIAIRPPLLSGGGLIPVNNNAFMGYLIEFVDVEVAPA